MARYFADTMQLRVLVSCLVFGCGPSPRATTADAPPGDDDPRPDAPDPTGPDAMAADAMPDSVMIDVDAPLIPDAPPSDPTPVIQLAAGLQHTCALFQSGAVRCWGSNDHGQLGYPGHANVGLADTPAAIGDVVIGGPAVRIAAGGFRTCAILTTGAVRCWGDSTALGYGTSANIGDDETPASAGDVPGLPATVIDLALASDHTCALASDGNVQCWGAGDNGALGYANTSSLTTPPATPVPVGGKVSSLGAAGAFGSGFTCAVVSSTSNSGVHCWGTPFGGRLGYGNLVAIGDDEAPTAAVPLGDPAIAVANGAGHACAITANHDVRCWGQGDLGRLGYAGTAAIGDDETPATAGIVNVGGAVDEIALGGAHTCARIGTAVRCWGMGSLGQLGYGTTANLGDDESPATAGDVPVGAPVKQITAGFVHTCALLDGGAVRCWGSGGQGQLGYANGDTIGDTETAASAGDVQVH